MISRCILVELRKNEKFERIETKFCINFYRNLIAGTKMAAEPPRWDKLSPTEFQQLQDLALCKY